MTGANQSVIPRDMDLARRYVARCFGWDSDEYSRFVKYLVVDELGLEWLDVPHENRPINVDADWESASLQSHSQRRSPNC